MKESTKMLEILKRECEEAKEQLLSDICENCCWPVSLWSEDLEEKCAECSYEPDLEALLQKARTIAVGETMKIAIEEITQDSEMDDVLNDVDIYYDDRGAG